ncbi:IBR domain, a half RING-finger domain-containing protein [Ditylenchus destructor]|uniref:E3 ubiquitin-protein ligase parkin n=1 Tax=Ditylenchus destructor TaxID=166010 RepID=A0AAD4RBU3_9BILA|nr:IBR domain, a half RING-finger domain-containing protein [Ditylenchus destructor]
MMEQSKQIQLLLRDGPVPQAFIVDLIATDTIGSIKTKLAQQCGISTELMKIVFCGRCLNENTTVDSLFLGPLTNLTVLISKVAKPSRAVDESWELVEPANVKSLYEDQTNESHSSFYVYCKKCKKMRRGKLRAYCAKCDSSAIMFVNQPNDWPDLGYKTHGAPERNRIKADCDDCGSKSENVRFIFKCTCCGEEATPLTHIRKNVDSLPCVICGEISNLFVSLYNCPHATCNDCFTAYCEQVHNQQNFVRKPSIGFTVACPVTGCSGCVSDVHHFYLLGKEGYERYQKSAAEMFFVQQTLRQYCPNPDCGAAFTLDEADNDEQEKMILCPECSKLYCRFCQSLSACRCNEQSNDENLKTIKRISKPCPNCGAPTERDGGCAHVRCLVCKAEWCHVCSSLWSDNCQWDHWFE